MDWITILTTMLPTVSITGLAFWKLDKQIKRADARKADQEALQSSVATQTQKLDLGDKYMELVRKIGDMIIENTELTKHGNCKLDDIVQKVSELEHRMAENEHTTAKLVEFGNGKFQEFIKNRKEETR